jgi:hypothetical protein
MSGLFTDLMQIFGLLIGILIFSRILYIFLYPLFCHVSIKITNTNSNENENIVEPDTIDIYQKNIIIVDAEYCLNQDNNDNLPIAIIL